MQLVSNKGIKCFLMYQRVLKINILHFILYYLLLLNITYPTRLHGYFQASLLLTSYQDEFVFFVESFILIQIDRFVSFLEIEAF